MTYIRRFAIVLSTLLLCCVLLSFVHNLSPKFSKIDDAYEHDSALNLSVNTDSSKLSNLLYNNGYVANQKDADFIADTLVARLKRMNFPNLYHLQKRDYGQVPMLLADSLGVLTNKVEKSKERVGLTDSLPSVADLKSDRNLGQGAGRITVEVKSDNDESCADAIVRLMLYYTDTLGEAKDTVIAYVKTDSQGKAQFSGLDKSKGYSVLPIKKGYEYGMMKGIHLGKFKKDNYTYAFTQLEHRIQMIDNATLKQIKNDGSITVRTPDEYKHILYKWFIYVILGWWLLYFVLVYRKKKFDPVLIATAMFLSGFCVLMMFSIQNPLTEDLRGVDMAKGVLMGLAIVILFQFIDFIKFYQQRYKLEYDIVLSCFNWLFLPFKRKVAWLAAVLSGHYSWYKKLGAWLLLLLCLPFGLLNLLQLDRLSGRVENLCRKMPKGFGYLILAVLITALLWTPLGQEIGGMKVNLKLGFMTFQPSEMAKYLIMFFIAAFFAQNADAIINYSRPDNTKIWNKVKILSWVIGGLVVLMGMYAALGDMGPALVLGVAFVLLYSLVKSKINLENLNEDDKWKRILTCDFAMLIYGVLSFALFIVIGMHIHNALLMAVLWFVAWILFGLARRKQFFETAFIMNMLVFAFVFGGQIMQKIPALKDTDTAERFEARTRMCVNTWGDLDIEHLGAQAEAVSNTQVANGLWAMATGGPFGQGMGNGNPNLIPAFHTDMILSSIGEQLGWFGLLIVVLVLAVLLRRMIVVGYRAGHPFAFYFCTGVAIVTGVQFFVIALGSSGMIPLTGITVPFLSYGRVSMIFNLLALGVVLSLSQNERREMQSDVEEEVRRRSVGDYNYPVSIVSWSFVILALFTLSVWQYYSVWKRNDTLVHRAFVYNKNGDPLIEYNPRIALVTKEMWAGNIYDRNGLLLATSDKSLLESGETRKLLVDSCGLSDTYLDTLAKAHTKRYYPFGEHLFFMLGDVNTGLYFSYNEDNPIGYMAEEQHLSYLRGFDNVLYKDGNPVKISLKRKEKGRFVDGREEMVENIVVRDYTALIPYLKDGTHGNLLKKHNDDVRNSKYDLYLTVDAKLQYKLQQGLAKYVEDDAGLKKSKYKHLLRMSVVVLDAENGDFLTSANYPLPDYERLKEEEREGHKSYTDNYKPKEWQAYTERDLGMTYQTAPGSTAKVMSAMAGLNKLGVGRVRSEARFPVYRYEVIDIKNNEVKEPVGNDVDMRTAIVESSNCYFINLVNHFDCYDELEKIYAAVGLSIGEIPNHKKAYALHYKPSDVLKSVVSETQNQAIGFYSKYIEKRAENKLNEIGINVNKGKTMRRGEWMWAWGQGTMDASPLNMARVVSAVINNGQMPVTHYLLKTADEKQDSIKAECISLTTETNAKELQSYMKDQARDNGKVIFGDNIGGKTGTPERVWKSSPQGAENTVNDGWYVFFIEGNGTDHPLAVAVRMERLGDSMGSRKAMELSKKVVETINSELKRSK